MSTAPLVARSRDELRDLLGRSGGRVALVPTMGALHDGHVALIEGGRAVVGAAGTVVVSIFVNPLQFGAGEDLDRYPRTFDADLETCGRFGVDVVFAPSVEEMYPDGVAADSDDRRVTVDPGELGTVLEGRIRPTHFRGVLTVVTKLFSLVRPDVAMFGEKDYQQLVLVRRMARDLSLGVDVVGVPTVREEDGLALSSRNRYLDEDHRWRATALSRTLFAAERAARYGATAALDAARHELRHARGVDLDYLELTAPDLGPPPEHGPARLLIAARVGGTRLIDNVALELNGEG
jgi:pantoate--beta-alanine ligase